MIFNRSIYFDYIEGKINTLATSIKSRGKLNILNYHNHSEDFYAYFLNELYGWQLKNANPFQHNIEAIDLVAHTDELVVQVSATNTVQKVENSLKKGLIKTYSKYTFKFVSIADDAEDLRTKTFKNPHEIRFAPATDIVDKNSILKYVLGMEIDPLRKVYDLIRKELGGDVDIVKLDSNLASIVNLLAKENWAGNGNSKKTDPFEINRKIEHNRLGTTKRIIDEYAIFKPKVESLYSEFDSLGANKSYAVLQQIGRYYIEEVKKSDDPDTIFLNVCERVMEQVKKSSNFINIESDILVLCADILVVDAFIRCKIFENPENYNHVTTR